MGTMEEKQKCYSCDEVYDKIFMSKCFAGRFPHLQQGHFLVELVIDSEQEENILTSVSNLKYRIGQSFSIPHQQILLNGVRRGSLMVSFQIPQDYITSFMFSSLHANLITSLKKERVHFIKFGDHEMFLSQWNILQDQDLKFGKTILSKEQNKVLSVKLNGEKCMALKYTVKTGDQYTRMGYVKYLENCLNFCHKNMVAVRGLYYPRRSSDLQYPLLITEKYKSLKKVISKVRVNEVDQVSFLLDIANCINSFKCTSPSINIKVDPTTIFTSKEKGQLQAKYCPLFGYSFTVNDISSLYHQQTLSLSLEDLGWMADVTKYLHFGRETRKKNLPDDHLMKKMLEQKWLSENDHFRPPNFKVLCEDLQQLLGKKNSYLNHQKTIF